MERTYATPLLDKLGIRPGSRVVLVRIVDPHIRELLAARTSDVSDDATLEDVDVVLLGAGAVDDLTELHDWRSRIRPNGAIWVVSRKGRSATLRDVEVMAAARAAGLVDNKVAAFSATHTALRCVIPLADRPR
ncbi:MAG: DUF3052 family protein [Chloroflexota bacterium]